MMIRRGRCFYLVILFYNVRLQDYFKFRCCLYKNIDKLRICLHRDSTLRQLRTNSVKLRDTLSKCYRYDCGFDFTHGNDIYWILHKADNKIRVI